MKILVAPEKPFAAAAIQGIREIIEGAGYELALLEKYTEKQQLLDAVADADGLIIRSDIVDNEVLDAAKNLKIVVRAGAGYDNVDLTSATAHNVCVENTPGQNSNAVAELAFGMMVMAARNMYDGKSGFELKGKHLGIQAFGQVGRNVARIGQGFGMEVEAVDPYCPETAMIELNVKPVKTVAELYAGNQFVSINIPATPETIKSINYELITSMPKNGVLVNTARKEVIDEEGLERALADRADLRYVSDVRPGNADSLLEKFAGRVFFTPKKMGAQTAEANANAGTAAAHQTVAFLRDGIDKFRVNR